MVFDFEAYEFFYFDSTYLQANFDFSKTFDSVRHKFLIQKLLKIGISGSLLIWVINYLTNRTQVVNVHSYHSSEKQVSSGLVQGSILGPTLFIVYINDINDAIHNCTSLKHEDDVKI